MTTFTLDQKPAVSSVTSAVDVFPIWQSGAQKTATANQIVTGAQSAGTFTSVSFVATATITGGLAKGAYSYGMLPYNAIGNFASIIAITGNCTTTATDIVLYGLIVEYRK
jgi:hypothetical protein